MPQDRAEAAFRRAKAAIQAQGKDLTEQAHYDYVQKLKDWLIDLAEGNAPVVCAEDFTDPRLQESVAGRGNRGR